MMDRAVLSKAQLDVLKNCYSTGNLHWMFAPNRKIFKKKLFTNSGTISNFRINLLDYCKFKLDY